MVLKALPRIGFRRLKVLLPKLAFLHLFPTLAFPTFPHLDLHCLHPPAACLHQAASGPHPDAGPEEVVSPLPAASLQQAG